MTSTLPQTGTAPLDRSLRMLAISVNLLPTEVVDARRTRHIRRIAVAALAAFIALIAAWYGFAAFQTASARSDLDAAQDETSRIVAEQRKFAKLASVQAESKTIDAQLKGLLADDLQWSKLLAGLQRSAPAGVEITGITGNVQSATQAAGGGAVSLPNLTGERLIGSVTILGSARSKPAIAAYADALGTTSGIANPLITGVNVQEGEAHFTVTADITASALGGRFTPAAKTKGAK